MTQMITSQHYLNADIVEAKRAAADYAVMVSPEFEVDGRTYRVVLDGHHSLAAALIDNRDIEISVAAKADYGAVALLDAGRVEDFLGATHAGEGDYIDAITRSWVEF